jgi:hypothetical protein
MTVKELIEILQAFPEDDLVILSKDAEGNEYSPLVWVEHWQYDGHGRGIELISFEDEDEPVDNSYPYGVFLYRI